MGQDRNIRLILEYDGTNYHGWQSQAGSGKLTIQETLEKAVRSVSGETCRIYSSGRTDAGVHALAHAINFHTHKLMPPHAWAPALNHKLPSDIRVLSSEEVSKDFHARYSALGKIYKYRILNRRAPSALYRNYSWHISADLDLQSMREAALTLLGRNDFSAFRGSGCSAKSPIRSLKRLDIEKSDDFLDLWFEADAFLQYMVRNITGTLVDVGLGRFTPGDVRQILFSGDRTRAGRTAPSQGLCLITVFY